MLNAIIRFALRQRMLVLAAALLVTGYGSYLALITPIDVFPDLITHYLPDRDSIEWGEWC